MRVERALEVEQDKTMKKGLHGQMKKLGKWSFYF